MNARIFVVASVLIALSIACATGPTTPRPSLYPSPTSLPTQTPWVQVVQLTTTPVVIEITSTPQPSARYCVSAMVAVHLRPSPSTSNYPIVQLLNGDEVVDLGGRSGNWWFVRYGDKEGWVDSNFIGNCNG